MATFRTSLVKYRKGFIWMLICGACVIFAYTKWGSPYITERRNKQLILERWTAMFYEQIPSFELLWNRSMECKSEFSTEYTGAWLNDSNHGYSYGFVWSEEKERVIGSYHAEFAFFEKTAKPISSSYRLKITGTEVMAILSDPLKAGIMPNVPILKRIKAENAPSPQKRAIQSFGKEIQAEIRSMKGMGDRKLNLWGMEIFISFDAAKNMELTMRMPLPNPYIATPVKMDWSEDLRFGRTAVPKIYKMLANSTFKGKVSVSRELYFRGFIVNSHGAHGHARFVVLAASGQVYRVYITEQRNGKDVEISIHAAHPYSYHTEVPLIARDLRPSFQEYVFRQSFPSGKIPINPRLPAQFHLSLDKDIPKITGDYPED